MESARRRVFTFAIASAMAMAAYGTEQGTWWDDEGQVSWRWITMSESQQRVEVYLCDRDDFRPKELTLPQYIGDAKGNMREVGTFTSDLFNFGSGHANADGLESVVIPDASLLGSYTFRNCADLKSVTFLGAIPSWFDFESTFAGTPYLAGLNEANGNDTAESARELAGAGGSVTDNNYLASPSDFDEDGYEPLRGFASWLVGTKWYKWTAPATTTAWFDTYGSDFNTVLGVYEMDRDGQQMLSVQKVKGENGDYNGISSLVKFSAEQGKTYYICVGGEQSSDEEYSARGNITLNWRTGTPVKLTLVTGVAGRNKKAITMTAYVPKGKAAGALPTPKRTGYAFLGWFTKVVGGTRILPTSKFNKATKLYAHWMIRSYRLSVKADEETAEGCQSVTGSGNYRHGTTVKISAVEKSGYKFGMWKAPEYEPTDTEFKNYYTLCRKNQTASVTVYGRNMWYEAYFVSENEDYMNLILEDDEGVPDLEPLWYAEQTASISIYLQAESATYPTVTTTKLPAGVTFKLAEDYAADAGEIERRDARYRFSVPDTSKLGPGKHTIKVTAKNRWGQIATQSLVVYGKNKTAADAWLGGIVTSAANSNYRMTVGITPVWGDFGISPVAGCTITKMTGLPIGVSWDAKKQTFTGYPTKAGTFTVSITATKKLAKNRTQSKVSTIIIVVDPMPDGLAGTFNGYTRLNRWESDQYPDDYEPTVEEAYQLCEKSKRVTLTVDATGKLSAKVGSTSFSGGGLKVVEGKYTATLTKKTTTRIGKSKTRTIAESLTFSINPDADRFGSAFVLSDSWYDYTETVPGSITAGPDTRVAARLNKFGKDLNGRPIDVTWNVIAGYAEALGEIPLYVWRSVEDADRYKFAVSQNNWPGDGYEEVGHLVDEGNGQFLKQTALKMTVDAATGVATLSGEIDGKSMNGTAVLSPEGAESATAQSMAAYARFFIGKFVIEVKLPLKTSHTAITTVIEGIDSDGITGDGWENLSPSYIE